MGRALAKIVKSERQKLEFRAHQQGWELPSDKEPRLASMMKKDSILRVRINWK